MNKIVYNFKLLIIVLLILISPIASSISVKITEINKITKENEIIQVIKIAQYPKFGGGCDESIQILFNYTWKINDKIYKFEIRGLTLAEVAGKGEKPLNVENYDLLYVGVNYWSFIKDGLRPKLVKNIKKFLSNGGGYLGSCAGAVFASQGYEKPKNLIERRVNKAVLQIMDAYINFDFFGEPMYCIKSNGLPPIELKVEKNNSNPIFNLYTNETLNLTYGGGPGLYNANLSDQNLGEMTTLLTFNEELMETKPIHFWKKRILGWKKGEVIKTDLLGNDCGIATTFNDSGRIVVFAAHAEIQLVLDGHIEEFIGKAPTYCNLGIFPRPVYAWIGNTSFNFSFNWWIHRRAAAWIAGVPDEDLPPCNELMVYMDKPQFRLGYKLYVNDKIKNPLLGKRLLNRILSRIDKTIIFGDITVEALAENSNIVEFYLDDILEYTDTESPFQWNLNKNLSGVHRLEIRAYDEYGNYACDGSEFMFYNIKR